ncbi:hypothetical protein QYS36_15050 [Pseudomonas sp. G34]|uniref:hypothetical protein n=1 Tax=Pseudomonas sp. G34 TaxID=3059083 RepID=UPI0028088946|nr:hypothetical protein [Pseudomonas sp. G34]MDQ7986256.1 hypothetical protein [Pseudomonas sp. G34]
MTTDSDFSRSESPFKRFKKLWRTDDPEWIIERKEQWRLLKKEMQFTASQQKTFSQFFVYGEALPAIDSGVTLNSSGLSGGDRLFMTPYSTAEEVSDLFHEFSQGQQLQVLTEFLRKARNISALPDRHEKVRLFIEGVYLPVVLRRELTHDLNDIYVGAIYKFMYDARRRLMSSDEEKDFYVLYAVQLFNELLIKVQNPESIREDIQEVMDDLLATVLRSQASFLSESKALLVEKLKELFASPAAAPWLKSSISRFKE